jgi:translocation and assembly module TamA
MKSIIRALFSLFIMLLCATICAKPQLTVSITGIPKPVYENISSYLKQKQPDTKNITDIMIKEQYFLNIEYIKEAMQPFGYFNPTIQSSLRQEKGRYIARYIIKPGTPVTYQKITYNAGTNPKWIPKDAIRKGQIFTSEGYQKTKTDLVHAATKAGYIYADIGDSYVTIDEANYSATAHMILHPGKRYRFGDIGFSSPYIDYDFLVKYAPFAPGDYYSLAQVEQFSKNLKRSGLFKSAVVIPKPDKETAPGDRVRINVNQRLKPKNEYQVGVGYDTDQYFQGTFSVINNYVTTEGANSNMTVKLGASELDAKINYSTPGEDPINSSEIYSFRINTNDDKEIGYSNYIQTSVTKRVYHQPFSIEKSLNLHYEKSEPNDADSYYSTLVYPEVGFFSDTMHRGKLRYSWNSSVLAAAKGLASTVNIIRGTWNSTAAYPLTDWMELSAKLQLGVIMTDDFDAVPLSFQFAAGGANSIRAYSYNSIGPGKILRVINTELMFHLYKELYLGGFADVGTVSNAIDAGKYYIGVGPTLQWKSVVGNANLSIAFPVDDPDNKSWRLQFSFTPHL